MQAIQLKLLQNYSRFLPHICVFRKYTLFNFHDILLKENSIKSVKFFKSICPELKIDGKRQAAVLIPLCIVNNEVSLLYTLRTNKLKRNSGQVSFPGGMREPLEQLQDTALRESCEELGLTESSIDIWGNGKFIVSRDVAIMPFLGNIGVIEPDKLNINHEEVQYAFALPLRHFCEPVNCRYTYFRKQANNLMAIPVYTNDYKRIWGMTAFMTWLTLRSVISHAFVHNLTSLHGKK